MVTKELHRDDVFHALADPTRRQILDVLRAGPLPAGDIAGIFPVSRPAVSKHLKALRAARLVTEARSGRQRVYALNPHALRPVDSWLSPYRQFWLTSLVRLKEHVESQEGKAKTDSTQRRKS
jgi:DNA-binding transcriptional ArsR family regulator